MLIKVKESLDKYITTDNRPIILSISGGVDSIVLLNILIKYFKHKVIHLIHFNYNSHSKSDNCEELVFELSKKYNCIYKPYSIYLKDTNFENLARNSRYEFLKNYSEKIGSNIILTAHHKNDQIETLVMKDICNSSWIGFLGIREKYKKIVRPMLSISKNQIYDYAKINKLKWIEDETNKSLKYKRNLIRYKLENNFFSNSYIKYLFAKKLFALKKIEKLKTKINIYKDIFISIKPGFINIDGEIFNKFDFDEIKIIIKSLVDDNFKINLELTKKHWNCFVRFTLESKQGSIFKISKNLIILKDRKSFILYKKDIGEKKNNIKLKNNKKWMSGTFKFVNHEKTININKVNIFSCSNEMFSEGLYVSSWKHGDCINYNNHRRKVSDLFVNKKISNYHKMINPIVRNYKGEIIWIPSITRGPKYENNDINIMWFENE